eukprot:gene22422-29534_t
MAIALSFFASGAFSIFSCQCLVESVLQAYLRGMSFGEIQTDLKLSTLTSGNPLLSESDIDMLSAWVPLKYLTTRDNLDLKLSTLTSGNPLLSESDIDMLSAWVALIYLTLEEVDVSGMDTHKTARQSSNGDMSDEQGKPMTSGPTIMQHFSRLVLLTLEVVSSLGLSTSKPLPNPVSINAPTGYTLTFMPGSELCPVVTRGVSLDAEQQQQVRLNATKADRPSRGLAVRLLISFMGAALGSEYSMQRFAEASYAIQGSHGPLYKYTGQSPMLLQIQGVVARSEWGMGRGVVRKVAEDVKEAQAQTGTTQPEETDGEDSPPKAKPGEQQQKQQKGAEGEQQQQQQQKGAEVGSEEWEAAQKRPQFVKVQDSSLALNSSAMRLFELQGGHPLVLKSEIARL